MKLYNSEHFGISFDDDKINKFMFQKKRQLKEKLAKIWNRESESYKFSNDKQPDYLADYYHIEYCLGDIKNKKILEVGSGSGQTSAYLASKGAIVHLVDISKKALEFSERYFKSRKLPVKLYLQDAFDMKFPDESFDYVWNGGVIEHFTDDEKIILIKKMWELVKPGGKLYISVPNANDVPFMIAKKILQIRSKWAFGDEDDLTINRMKKLAVKVGVNKFSIYAYNPIVGFWFFPYGREMTNFLKLNAAKHHQERTPFGHVIVLCAQKPSKR
jgi:2-polyprenyl-3-methyl-5-hydroxy-6-metoxy-1,4-benzoquinol methylase